MAHYFVSTEKDAMISRGQNLTGTGSLKNHGADEIIEVGKSFQKASTKFAFIARGLIKFDITQVSKSVSSGDIKSNAKYCEFHHIISNILQNALNSKQHVANC